MLTWRPLVLATVIAGSYGPANAQQPAAPALREITVDATLTVGTLRPFSGTHGAPAAEFTAMGTGDAPPDAVDISADYRAARIDLVRTHDGFGPGDIDARFGADANTPLQIAAGRNALTIFSDMSADAENPASYNFAPTDRMIASIKSVGAEPLFRIGRSIGGGAEPPADMDKYAQIARHIVMHYNQGWDKGFHYAIRYWEIWNEPDFKYCWSGSAQLYYSLYQKTALAIKSADDDALIGGPTLANPLDGGAYREAFMDYVRWNRLPFDFFSWHFYTMDSNDPYSLVSIARELRLILNARGFGSTKNVLDEWNMDLFDRDVSTAARAAFATSALIYMLGGPIDNQTYYRGDTAFRHPHAEPDAVGHALIAFGSLKSTPMLLRTSGGDDAGMAVVAGRSADRRNVQVLISNYQIPKKYLGPRANGDVLHVPNGLDVRLPPRRSLEYHDNDGYDLTVILPAGGKYRVSRYRISESANFALVDQTLQMGPVIHLQAPLPPPGIEFITLSAL